MLKSLSFLMAIVLVILLSAGCAQQEPLDLSGVRVVMLIDDRFNYEEASSTLEYLKKIGATVTIAGPSLGEIRPYDNETKTLTVEVLIKEVKADDFDSLYVPGGYSADSLKTRDDVRVLVASIYEQEKVVAAICLGPVVLGQAGVLKGLQVSATNAVPVYEELIGLGAIWANAGGVVKAGRVVTGRGLDDLPLFNSTYAKAIANAIK